MDELLTSFLTQLPSKLTALLQRETVGFIPFLYQCEFRNVSRFLTTSEAAASLPKLFPRMAPLRAPKRCKSDVGCMVGGEEQSIPDF
jgi:hypothetical protein